MQHDEDHVVHTDGAGVRGTVCNPMPGLAIWYSRLVCVQRAHSSMEEEGGCGGGNTFVYVQTTTNNDTGHLQAHRHVPTTPGRCAQSHQASLRCTFGSGCRGVLSVIVYDAGVPVVHCDNNLCDVPPHVATRRQM